MPVLAASDPVKLNQHTAVGGDENCLRVRPRAAVPHRPGARPATLPIIAAARQFAPLRGNPAGGRSWGFACGVRQRRRASKACCRLGVLDRMPLASCTARRPPSRTVMV